VQREGNANIYVRTSSDEGGVISGETLAKAFDVNVKPNHKTIFFRSIEAGHITEKEVNTILESFDFTSVPGNTDEEKLLIQLRLQKDFPLRIEEEPLTFRRQTVNILMQHLEASNGTDQIIVGLAFIAASTRR